MICIASSTLISEMFFSLFFISHLQTGRTVCATIHQPSAAVFEMFDDLLLLMKGGNTGEACLTCCSLQSHAAGVSSLYSLFALKNIFSRKNALTPVVAQSFLASSDQRV
jgi:hypothetical protein